MIMAPFAAVRIGAHAFEGGARVPSRDECYEPGFTVVKPGLASVRMRMQTSPQGKRMADIPRLNGVIRALEAGKPAFGATDQPPRCATGAFPSRTITPALTCGRSIPRAKCS